MALIPLDDPEVEPRSRWERYGSWLVVVVCCVFVASWVHVVGWKNGGFESLVFRDTTTNGGDMGAHVYWPWFLEREWFSAFRVQGWSPHWYSGFPIGQFYFPLPALAISLLDLIPFISYNQAFKIVVVSGPIALPAAAYYFGSKLRFPWPAPPLFAIVAVRYLFEVRYGLNNQPDATGWTIYGGNLASTMAGEFSFTIALALALFFLGSLAQYLRTGRRGWLPAVLLAGCVTSHIVVAAFAAVLALLVVAMIYGQWTTSERAESRSAWRRLWRLSLPPAVVAFLLTSTWTLPLVGAQHMTASMRYEKQHNWGSFLFGLKSVDPPDGDWTSSGSIPRPLWLWLLVMVAVFLCGWWRRSSTLIVLIGATFFGALFVVWPEHHIWNTRFAPFYWLLLGFAAAIGAAELSRLLGYLWVGSSDWIRAGDRLDYIAEVEAARDAAAHRTPADPQGDAIADPDAVAWTPPAFEMPPHLRDDHPRVARRRAITLSAVVSTFALAMGGYSFWWTTENKGVGEGWARYNFEGYESKPGWTEYKALMDAMGALEPGRALWETGRDEEKADNDGAFGNYGGDLALELLPYWTNGRIGSMEGLYFESSATMPYHFLTISHVSEKPSQPVRGLRYANDYPHEKSFDLGVRQMRALGVRYFMAFNPSTIERADAHPDLDLVTSIGDFDGVAPKQWKVYEIAEWALVAPLPYEPVVVEPVGGTQADCFGENPSFPTEKQFTLDDWECSAAPWWMQSDEIDRPFAESGPAAWSRLEDASDLASTEPKALPPVEISDVVETTDTMSFRVDQIGIPVVVRTSYFPNWRVSGADGPWRLSPNMMVVVPTDETVTLSYGSTSWDWLGRVGTLLGVAGLIWMVRRRPDRAAWFALGVRPGRVDGFGVAPHSTPASDPMNRSMSSAPTYDAPTSEPGAGFDDPSVVAPPNGPPRPAAVDDPGPSEADDPR